MALNLEIIHHKNAPLFKRNDASLLFRHIKEEVESASFHLTDELRVLIHQAGLVNLWFFLKFIVGQEGPFEKLNETLHVDMCNFRQSLLKPGTRGLMLLPRGTCKSKIVTEGGTAWELVRDPEQRFRITNATDGNAHDFHHTVKTIFDANSFFQY